MRFVNRKVALVGTGLVGMSYAYALLNQSVCDELALIDIDQQRAQGEAMDLNHGLAFSGSNMKIYAGGYQDCSDADIVAVCAGVAQSGRIQDRSAAKEHGSISVHCRAGRGFRI